MGNKTERSTKKRVIFHLSAAFIFLLVALFDNTDLVLGARKKAGDANAPTGRGRGKQVIKFVPANRLKFPFKVKVKSEDDNNSTPSNRGRSAGRGKALVKPGKVQERLRIEYYPTVYVCLYIDRHIRIQVCES